jgi:hypothetical protein
MPLTGTSFIRGLREITVKGATGAPVKFPAAMTLTFKEVLTSGELRGNDVVVANVSFTDKVEWSVENGGISLEALSVMTGRAITLSGTGAAEVNTMSIKAGDAMPYFELRGRALSDNGGDLHSVMYKCKLADGFEGEMKDGEFYIQSCSGVALGRDSDNKIMDIVQNETATALPVV